MLKRFLLVWLKYSSQSGANGRVAVVKNMKATFLGEVRGEGFGLARDADRKRESSSSGGGGNGCAVVDSSPISWWFWVGSSLETTMASGGGDNGGAVVDSSSIF